VIATFGGLTFDSTRRQVLRANGDAVHLTPKAFDLLALLIAEAPRVVAKSELHESLWPGVFVSDATLVGLVKELRRALGGHHPESPIIRTSHGAGYAFAAPLDTPGPGQSEPAHWIVTPDRRIPLGAGTNLLGRDPASAVWLDLAGVSRRHARIVVRGQTAEIEDLVSKNGTTVKGTPVTSPTLLRDGAVICLGPARLTYRLLEAGRTTETVVRTPAARGPGGDADPRNQP
jgi:DNA-binding winged helix-turn-helix (wHTH) protein